MFLRDKAYTTWYPGYHYNEFCAVLIYGGYCALSWALSLFIGCYSRWKPGKLFVEVLFLAIMKNLTEDYLQF
jgi:hypothetical protein